MEEILQMAQLQKRVDDYPEVELTPPQGRQVKVSAQFHSAPSASARTSHSVNHFQ